MGRMNPPIADAYYEAAMDLPCGASKALTYMLATIPRSGSTYCAVKFWRSGILGSPMEYLNFRASGRLLNRLGYDENIDGDRLLSYWDQVQRLRTTANGVFGFKMFTPNYVDIAKRSPLLLNRLTPNYVVYLTRKDALGQAISYSRAIRSKVWFADVSDTPSVCYDKGHITWCLSLIESQKMAWEKVFALTKVTPIRILYEDLLDSRLDVVSQVAQRMGLKKDWGKGIAVPMISRQSDEVSDEWRRRFISETGCDDARVTQP